MKSWICRILVLCMVLLLFTGCGGSKTTINGIDISEYTLVYDQNAPDYCLRAAEYIQAETLARTGIEIPVCEAQSGTYSHEILVGETDRALSTQLDADTKNVEFAILADKNHIALEGDYFIIAAAAYYFVQTYIPGSKFQSTVPQEISIHSPITEAPNNYIFLIGDGMGFNHTKLVEEYEIANFAYDSDNERIFYGNYLPYQGMIQTASLSGVTDSAAAATALACGYKTINSYVGKDQNGNDVTSLTELAISKGMATAVMSTDQMTGATPSGFSAHAMNRDLSDEILACQQKLMLEHNTIFECGLHSTGNYQDYIADTLTELGKNESGFFIMYEEGYIDKFSHKMQLEDTLFCVGRFNQAIGIFMEYAFYHPDTFLIITADHETGGLMENNEGKLGFNTESHTAADVPIYGYGQGTEVFQDCQMQNNNIPKIIAELWGAAYFGGN